MMAASQKQMLYMFPLMTVLFGYQFPFGLVLYWTVFLPLAWLSNILRQAGVTSLLGYAAWEC